MKAMKKILALVLGTMMALALCVTAFADETTAHTITITNADPAQQHTYEAYQILVGTYDEATKQLTELGWGSGIDGAALLTELKAAGNPFGDAFKTAENAVDVARVLTGFGNNSSVLDAFALAVGNHLTTTVAGTSTQTKSPYTINVTGDGYYFVKDKDSSVTAEGESYSKYMLKVVKNETIEAKDDHLVSEKKIIEGNEKLDANSAAIGDEILYEITIPMPKMDGYQKYYFLMEDVMCKGLTFQEIKSVKVGNTELVEKTAGGPATCYISNVSAPNANGETTLTIEFCDFIQYKGTTGSVVVRYTATLNEQADLTKSNDNTVRYAYSNNPAHSGDGEFDDDDFIGHTPWDTVRTYVTELKVTKIGDGNENTKLANAQFQLEGEALNLVLVTGIKYEPETYTAQTGEEIEAGKTYYLLKDGTYTETAPTDLTVGQYENEGKDKYVKVSFSNVKMDSESVDVIVTTDANGVAEFKGLKPGTYTLTELVAPSGYNKVAPIQFEIKWNENDGFTVVNEGNAQVQYDAANKLFTVTVDNKSGSVLPSTGRGGTVIFTVLGSILVIGAGVLLVAKRRMDEKD